jgi:phage baseplate assembly protein gpV
MTAATAATTAATALATAKAASWDITGDIALHGTLTADKDVIANGISLHNHKHGKVTAGLADTDVPK